MALATIARELRKGGGDSVANPLRGLPKPISFSDAFNAWVPRRFDPPAGVFYYVNDELGADVEALFREVRPVDRIDDPYAREFGTTIYRCSRHRRPFQSFWDEVLARDPSPY
ncbi:hypothetical protein [Lewinella sp. IMCC34183]|uniref:hypothetical protein n=1 Tax=Lewinella sp. IMCC34183 TaxID=2248762 RepID=UPI000E262DB3|nr:hypothetical protein [Lewinella sp. IMCC34183]